jgi:hypothetical protein
LRRGWRAKGGMGWSGAVLRWKLKEVTSKRHALGSRVGLLNAVRRGSETI